MTDKELFIRKKLASMWKDSSTAGSTQMGDTILLAPTVYMIPTITHQDALNELMSKQLKNLHIPLPNKGD
jgi:hypothetical protein